MAGLLRTNQSRQPKHARLREASEQKLAFMSSTLASAERGDMAAAVGLLRDGRGVELMRHVPEMRP